MADDFRHLESEWDQFVSDYRDHTRMVVSRLDELWRTVQEDTHRIRRVVEYLSRQFETSFRLHGGIKLNQYGITTTHTTFRSIEGLFLFAFLPSFTVTPCTGIEGFRDYLTQFSTHSGSVKVRGPICSRCLSLLCSKTC